MMKHSAVNGYAPPSRRRAEPPALAKFLETDEGQSVTPEELESLRTILFFPKTRTVTVDTYVTLLADMRGRIHERDPKRRMGPEDHQILTTFLESPLGRLATPEEIRVLRAIPQPKPTHASGYAEFLLARRKYTG